MSRPPAMPAEEKLKLVLSVLAGERSIAAAARQAQVSEQSVGNWKRQFIEGGLVALEGSGSRNAERERELLTEIAELKTALGEAYVEMRVRRKVADYRVVPSQPSRQFEMRSAPTSRGSATSWEFRGAPIRAGR